MIIYFTGIDGSGKTTIIEQLKNSVFKGRNVEIIWGRYTPRFVSLIINILKKRTVKSSNNYNGMSATDYSTWKQFKKKLMEITILKKMAFALQVFDYMFQIIKIEKKIYNNQDVLIIDRYILDFIVDQSINYGDISNWYLSKYLLKKMNKIKNIIFLTVPSDVALKRKEDIPSMEYLEDRKKVYYFFSKRYNNINIVNNNRDINETIKNIQNLIEENK